MTITASEILGQMADLLETEGWIQHESRNEEGRCMIGAYQDVLTTGQIEPGLQSVAREALHAMHSVIQEVDPPVVLGISQAMLNLGGKRTLTFTTIPVYNDKYGRTKDEVLNVINKARIGLEEQGK